MAPRLTHLALAGIALVSSVHGQAEGDRADREAWFAKHLTGSRLVGSFTVDDAPTDEAPRPDSYTLKSVTKNDDGTWRFEAVIEYGEKPITVPLNLPVEWAGDTPVITVTELAVPFLGTYSARVLFHGDLYAGTWSGKTHGGHLWGEVVRGGEAQAAPPTTDEDEQATVHWPSFRGRGARGVSKGFATLTEWDVDDGTGLRWKTSIPGLCHSSPVVWGDRVYLVGAARLDGEEADQLVGLYGDIAPVVGEGDQRFFVMCLDKNTGEVLWDETAWEGEPAIMRHPKGSHAASTPATDGTCVVAFFGSEGLYCYEPDGTLRWKKDFGVLDSGYYVVKDAQWGFASSPILHGDRVIVQVDVQGQSFVAALDVDDGEELWRTDREEVPTWGTPTVDVRDGRAQVIVNGFKHMGAYDLETGEELWKLSGGGDIPVPTPIVHEGLVYLTNAHGKNAPILAIDAMATGELGLDAEEHEGVVWGLNNRRGNYMQTPLVLDGLLYCCNDGGILRCYDARTGEEQYAERLGAGSTGFTGSGVAADGKLYFTSEEGEVHVVRAGPEFELLAVNPLGETLLSTPAISEGTLFFRARRHLFAVGADAP